MDLNKIYMNLGIIKENRVKIEGHLTEFGETIHPNTLEILVSQKKPDSEIILKPIGAITQYNIPKGASDTKINLDEDYIEFTYDEMRYRILLPKE